MAKLVHTITAADLRKPASMTLMAARIRGAIGIVQPHDVGKRVYDTGDGVYQVENDEQRDARIRRAAQHDYMRG